MRLEGGMHFVLLRHLRRPLIPGVATITSIDITIIKSNQVGGLMAGWAPQETWCQWKSGDCEPLLQ